MNQIARQSPQPVMPPLTPAVAAALDAMQPRSYRRFGDPDDTALVISGRPPPPDAVADAKRILPAMEQACRPAGRALIGQWLNAIGMSLRNPPSADEVDVMAGLLIDAGDLPVSLFTHETRLAAFQDARDNGDKAVWRFWPAPVDAYAWLSAHAAPIRSRLDGLRRLAGWQAPATPTRTAGDGPSEAERVAVALKLGAWRQEVAAREPAPALRETIPAKPLAPDVLRAMRDANPVVTAARRMQAELREDRP